MSRVAKMPVTVPDNVKVSITDSSLSVSHGSSNLALTLNSAVNIVNELGKLNFQPVGKSREANAMSGTMRQLTHNMIIGVTTGFEKKLSLVGVGYKAQAKGSVLSLSVGYSHPVNMDMPEGITVATPLPTEIMIKGADRQRVGQVAAEIRAIRSPEPYKGKGIRYADEKITIKETKKK